MADDPKPLSNLPELVPAAAFMEDVNAFMQGARRGARQPAPRRRRRRSTPPPPLLLSLFTSPSSPS